MKRNPRERVQALAPFLAFDGDPYPVAVDGRVVWVIDGYTTSSRYPYAQNADLVAARGGSRSQQPAQLRAQQREGRRRCLRRLVTLYVNDPNDPVLQVWQSAFPDLFSDQADMPADLAEHLRYPEELFRLQTAAYSKYRLEGEQFFDREGAWSVALAAPEQPPQQRNST
jgi:uncharacterized membrane protein (UPF0182 family)